MGSEPAGGGEPEDLGDTKTATVEELNDARILTLNDLRYLLTESAEMILRSLGDIPVPGPGPDPQAAPIDTRLFVRSVAPHLRMN